MAADALMAAWLQWDRVCASDRPVAYVRRMLVNIAVSRIRTRSRDRRRFLALIPWAAVDQVVDADTGADPDLRVALLALPPRRRACLVLRYAFDLPEQVAISCRSPSAPSRARRPRWRPSSAGIWNRSRPSSGRRAGPAPVESGGAWRRWPGPSCLRRAGCATDRRRRRDHRRP